MRSHLIIWLLLIVAATSLAARREEPARPALATQFRRPVAAAWVDGRRTLAIANQRSGSVSLVDIDRATVTGEWPVGQHLADLVAVPRQKFLLAVDEKCHELIALRYDADRINVVARLPVSRYPVTVRVNADGTRATVACRWSRRVQVIDLTGLRATTAEPTLRILQTIELPLAPRMQMFLPGDEKLLVADAFGGRLAVIDVEAGRVPAIGELPGHNIRGLAVSADGRHVLVAHQVLDEQAETSFDHVRLGDVMRNQLTVIPCRQLLAANATFSPAWMVELGTPWVKTGVAGSADPAGVAVVDGEQMAVALAGSDELGLVRSGAIENSIGVGRRPLAVLNAGDARVVVINMLSDSISIVDVEAKKQIREISLGPSPEPYPRDRGERLFYDASLSPESWMSCHSCHTDGHTNGRLADTDGDNSYGTPKRVLTLLGTGLTDHWAWNGQIRELRQQVHKSLETTMHCPQITAQQIDDLSAYLQTLSAPPPLEPAADNATDREQIDRGRSVFHKRGCIQCHVPPLTYTSQYTYDVGFSDERGEQKFNPPSLRGVGQGATFLHDGRAKRLEDVFSEFGHELDSALTDQELADLVRFLRSI